MKTSDFLFDLPEELIAQYPPDKREMSRLMVLGRGDNSIEHKTFEDIVDYFRAGDLLILNNTKVLPARVMGKTENGKTIGLLIAEMPEINKINKTGTHRILSKGKYTGRVFISEDFYADVSDGNEARFHHEGTLEEQIQKYGYMPLPPYIKRPACSLDTERYQTVYAEKTGSIAAPTAGLHFTHETLDKLRLKGVVIETITLHVGEGTFRPVHADYVSDHKMDSERFEIDTSLLEKIEETRTNGNKIVSVGTTTTRAIEAVSSGRYNLIKSTASGNGCQRITAATDIFIYPGYEFKAVTALITNFHLPRSTPVLMACAFAGKDLLLRAYESAVAARYRFFSYGDVMLIV